jgi:hypothetical protein
MMMTELSPIDIDAINRAIELQLKREPAQVEQVKFKLAHNDRLEVGCFCAASLQRQDLELPPWEVPPCSLDPDRVNQIIDAGVTARDYTSAVILRQLVQLGLSGYDPTPRASIERARAALEQP